MRCSVCDIFLGGVVDLYTVDRIYILLDILASIVRDSNKLSVKWESSELIAKVMPCLI